MKITGVPFSVTDWDKVPAVEYRGETGTSTWRAVETGNLRLRIVDYSPGFKSDHWCARGHVLYVLSGELGLKLRDGRDFLLAAGASFQVEDDEANPHLAWTDRGARVFIVD
jgi:quercetin dioxygenase-like cupin family protein